MGERADALASHIRQQREELGDNIRELNFRMKEAVDSGMIGLRRIHPTPERTVRTVKENVRWAKEQMH